MSGALRPVLASISEECTGYHHGQTDITLLARDGAGLDVGRLDYNLFRGGVHIAWIEVVPDARRTGVGTGLLEHLASAHPGSTIHWGMTTPEGAALRRAFEARARRSMVASAKERLAGVAAGRSANRAEGR